MLVSILFLLSQTQPWDLHGEASSCFSETYTWILLVEVLEDVMQLVEIVVHLVLITAALSKREVVSLLLSWCSLDDTTVSSFVLALVLILLLGLAAILILV